MAVVEPATLAECRAIFESVQSLTFADDAAKQARRHAFIDGGAVARIQATLAACCASGDIEGQIAATAALSELSFLCREVARLQAFVPVLPLLVRLLSRARSLELRVWAIFALCNCTSNAPPGSNMLEETWRSGAMDAALSWLALYLAAKDVMHEAGAIDAHATVTDFMKVPAHEAALRAVAEEDLLRDDEGDDPVDAAVGGDKRASPCSMSAAEMTAAASAASAPAAAGAGSSSPAPASATASAPGSPATPQPAAGERLSAAMSVGGHRIAMNALALCVIFSRSDAFMMRTRSRKLADCAPFQHYRRWLKRRVAAKTAAAAGSRGASPERVGPGSLPVLAVDWRSGVLHHPLFSPRATSLDLAIYAMESTDPFYAHVAASVLAYQMGAEELSGSSDPSEPLPAAPPRSASASGGSIARCATGGASALGTASSASLPAPLIADDDCDAILVSDSDDGSASSSGSDVDIDGSSGGSGVGLHLRAGAASPAPGAGPGGAAAADARRLRRRVAKTRFTDAARRMQRGFPVEAVHMLLEAARAGLANRRYKGFVAYLRVWTYLQPLANIAVADVNKRTLLSLGAIDVAAQALAHPDDRSRQYASQLLWLLAFDAEAKAAIATCAAALDGLKALSKDKNTAVRMQALGALWQIQAMAPSAGPAAVDSAGAGAAGVAHIDGAAAVSVDGVGAAAVRSQSTFSTDRGHRHDDGSHEIVAEAAAVGSLELVPRPVSSSHAAVTQPTGDHIVSLS